MVLWFSKSPANVRDGWSILQKTSQCEGWLKRSPKAQPMWGMADAFPRRQRMWGASWYFTYTYYQCPWPLTTDYYYFKLYSATLHHYSSLIIAIPSYILLIMIIALTHRDWPLKGVNNHPTPPPCLFCDHKHLLHLTFSTAISHNFGRWWSRESNERQMAATILAAD